MKDQGWPVFQISLVSKSKREFSRVLLLTRFMTVTGSAILTLPNIR